ncbi:MAG: hypothetical protein JNL13_05515 [Chitinophagaceae bacterium]|nr:hypothetical protein [Chitinophagaceae bacterium]
MEQQIIESMDISRYSKEELEEDVRPFLESGWHLLSGIDESVLTNEKGNSVIIYTRTLVRYPS